MLVGIFLAALLIPIFKTSYGDDGYSGFPSSGLANDISTYSQPYSGGHHHGGHHHSGGGGGGGGGGHGGGEHIHKGEVLHRHIHEGRVDHIHKHVGHAEHDHKHEGHAGHDHKHHGHAAHDHKHAGHGVHDHKHGGHGEHYHSHHGQAEHGHKHVGSAAHSHKHHGAAEHAHKHLGHGEHSHSHGGHAEHDHKHLGHGEHLHKHAGQGHHSHKHAGQAGHSHKHVGHAQHSHAHGGHADHAHKHDGHAHHAHGHQGPRMEVFIKTTIIFFFITYSRCMRSKLEEVFSWKIIDFDFPSIEKREIAIKNKSFIPENNQLMGLEVWKNKLFVSLPPWRTGLAATLAFIDLDQIEGKSPKLKPYPNWETHDLRNSTKGNKLANVIRLNVDHCGRLWVADRGIINIMGSRDRIHSPKIQIFDAETDEVLKVYNIPDDMINDYSFFGSIVADVSTSDCAKAYAYVSDLRANALFVYSLEQDDMWRVEHHFFHFEPLSGNYIVGDVNFQWTDGIIGISLSPEQADGYKILYFCPMSSTRLFAVSTRIIQNNTIDWSSWNNTDIYYQFEVIGNRGAFMQSTTSTIDSESGIMFYTLLCQDTIACWNPKNEYSINGQGVIARDKKTLSYPNDVKVDKNGILWVLSNRLHQFVFTGQNFSDINFRIFRVPVHEAIRGTVCEKN